MKTLVIHPLDSSTEFLSEIYDDMDWTIIKDNKISKSNLKKTIKVHDRIIMMGHGSENGLFGDKKMMIDSSFVYLLKEKNIICIWCNADSFAKKYNLKGIFTGMIISDYEEALLFCFYDFTSKQIEESNSLFSGSIKKTINNQDFINEMKLNYCSDNNAIIQFNQQNILQYDK